LLGARIALVVVEEVAEPSLLGWVAARDDVQIESATRDALVGRGHLRRQRRGDESGPEGDEEPQPVRLARERRGEDPCVLAPCPRRRQRAREAELLRRPPHLQEVVDRGLPAT